MRKKILFQGSHVQSGRRQDPPALIEFAEPFVRALGRDLIHADFNLILTGFRSLDKLLGEAAVSACLELGVNPRERIRTYPHGVSPRNKLGFGMVLEPLEKRWQEVRTFVVQEADAVVATIGGKGTSDCVQKAVLAHKAVFPVAVAGGASQVEWERLRRSNYCNKVDGDLDFLADRSIAPEDMAKMIVEQCGSLLNPEKKILSRRIFIVHGHDDGLKNELARFLERLEFVPVILHEQPDKGQTIFSKLNYELSDVGFAFILLTPDDMGGTDKTKRDLLPRARQNVVFEHGLLTGILGAERVCAIVKGSVEIPSDLSGILYKQIKQGNGLQSIAVELIKELKNVGYELDANKL